REQHERFFPEPWQIASVMDHQTPERALYHVLAGEWKRLPGYYVLRDMAANEIGIASPGGSSRWLKAALAVLVVGLLVVGAPTATVWCGSCISTPRLRKWPRTNLLSRPALLRKSRFKRRQRCRSNRRHSLCPRKPA